MRQLMYIGEFVQSLNDYADAIKRVPTDQLKWSHAQFDKASDYIRKIKREQSRFECGVDPIGFLNEDWWCYCMRYVHEGDMCQMQLHYDISVTDEVDAGIQVTLKIEEPHSEYPDERNDRGTFRILSRKRNFYIHWYGKIFDVIGSEYACGTVLSEPESKLLETILDLANLEAWSFRGELRISKRNAFRMIRAFVRYMKSSNAS